MKSIDEKVLNKFPKYIQKTVTFAEKDCYGKYHIVVRSEQFGEASFHETNLAELQWLIKDFLMYGSRY